MTVLSRLTPRSMPGQMIAILALSLTLLLTVLTFLESAKNDSALELAESDFTLNRIRRMKPVLESIGAEQVENFLDITSRCHEGYTLTAEPGGDSVATVDTDRLKTRIARELDLGTDRVIVGFRNFTRSDFSFNKCSHSAIDLPMEGILISLQLETGNWLNTEVHPHEWHFEYMLDWVMRSTLAFILIGGIAIFFMRRLSKPLDRLTNAAQLFGQGLEISPVQESGPPDLKRAIESFNAMQRQVTDEIDKRMNTLAAVSHDIRTPLTALRLKAELIDDDEIRRDLISSIDKMEKIAASALEFLKGESRAEPMRKTDLSALLESECSDFEEMGQRATFAGENRVHYTCRPDALARAVRNLIENANKYGTGATVTLRNGPEHVDISVSDNGPGIAEDKIELALEPFARLSKARESDKGGFGLGLAVAKAIAEGHDGTLLLEANRPRGLIATIRLPFGKAA